MSFIVIIPARYASTRLPGKPLQTIAGKAMIAHVVDRANESSAERVIVATDDQRIADALVEQQQSGLCEVCMTQPEHQSGSDRLAEVVEKLNIDDSTVVVNVQGDEPLIPAKLINQVALTLSNQFGAVMSTAAHQINDVEEINNPNVVKVVFNQQAQALYFSRSCIPHDRDQNDAKIWRHVGIYAYRADFLKRYHLLASSELEESEKLEQLRVMDNGETILVAAIDYDTGIGVDTQEDLEKVRNIFSN